MSCDRASYARLLRPGATLLLSLLPLTATAQEVPPAEPAPAEPAPAPAAEPAPSTAKKAGKWDGHVADIRAEGLVPAPPEAVFAYALDMSHWPVLFPETCVGRLELGERTYGEGATAIVRYDMGMMHRKLPVTLTHATAPDRIDFEHVGKKGFFTRWSFVGESGGTRVTLLTPLNAPPKPLQGYYYTVVQAEWTECYETVIANLARVLAQ